MVIITIYFQIRHYNVTNTIDRLTYSPLNDGVEYSGNVLDLPHYLGSGHVLVLHIPNTWK